METCPLLNAANIAVLKQSIPDHVSFPCMTTGQAVKTLRTKLRLSQPKFAKALGLGFTTVVRYEKGDEPSQKGLRKLTDLADAHGLEHLADIFRAKLIGDVAEQVDKIPSAGSSRRVRSDELDSWANGWLLGSVVRSLETAIAKMEPLTIKVHRRGIPDPPEHKVEVTVDQLVDILGDVKGAKGVASWLASAIQTYIDGSVPERPPKKKAAPRSADESPVK
jgi:transcriptional regulator with XRE-family HTH domain